MDQQRPHPFANRIVARTAFAVTVLVVSVVGTAGIDLHELLELDEGSSDRANAFHITRTSVSASVSQPVDGVGGDPVSDSDVTEARALITATGAQAPAGTVSAVDARIRSVQARLSSAPADRSLVDRLGWLFIAKARDAGDDGYFHLAVAAADVLESLDRPSDAQLLRGHALHSLHRFADALGHARALVANRGGPADYGLLGDILLDRGRVGPAVHAYRHMMRAKPGAQAYARVAEIRRIRGDLEGAVQAMEMAVRSAPPRNVENAAWYYGRSARFLFESGRLDEAASRARTVLALRPRAGGAREILARVLLARGRAASAALVLQPAAFAYAGPDAMWAYQDSLELAGFDAAATAYRPVAREVGEARDARGYALYLATSIEVTRSAESADRAVDLALAELDQRRDATTWATLAAAQLAAGRVSAAVESATRAIARRHAFARIDLVAARAFLAQGDRPRAAHHAERAVARAHQLLPSERAQLDRVFAAFAKTAIDEVPEQASGEFPKKIHEPQEVST